MFSFDSELKDVIMNSWINRESPTDVSTMAHFKNGGYEDILEPRRVESDLSYSFKPRVGVATFKYNKKRTPSVIADAVLSSDRVDFTINKITTELGVDRASVVAEAQSILTEMKHQFSFGMVRSVAYFLIKVFKSMFTRIYVNRDAMQMLQRLMKEHPILLMPTHRSYIDFLVISYIFYEYDLTLPVIATAMDFKDMFLFGWLIRKMGGFYIRRSFGSDKLYWAIFTEYVQSHLRNADAPVEFFVEGTRSRSAKSYQPKIGMLSASLESYFKAEVYDIQIVPIAICYERIVEEMLYSFELLGVPKPKESSRGLLKARSILQEDYGCLHFHVCDPISIRQFSANQIDRTAHSLEPRYINSLTLDENELIQKLGTEIILRQQQHTVISPCALIATILIQRIAGISDLSMTCQDLMIRVNNLRLAAKNLAAYVNWPADATDESIIRHYIALHSNILNVTDGVISLKAITTSNVLQSPKEMLITRAASCLALASYRNQLLHVFQHVGIVSTIVENSDSTLDSENLYNGYSFLRTIFQKEFIFKKENATKDFRNAVLNLMHSGSFQWPSPQVQNDISSYKFHRSSNTRFLSNMFQPFLLSYALTCQFLLQRPNHIQGRPVAAAPKPLARQIQSYIIDYALERSRRLRLLRVSSSSSPRLSDTSSSPPPTSSLVADHPSQNSADRLQIFEESSEDCGPEFSQPPPPYSTLNITTSPTSSPPSSSSPPSTSTRLPVNHANEDNDLCKDDWQYLEVVSLAKLNNCVDALVSMGILVREKRQGSPWIVSKLNKIQSIIKELGKYVVIPEMPKLRPSL